MGESEKPREPTFRLPTVLAFLFFPLGLVDLALWAWAQARWGCEYAVGTDDVCDGPITNHRLRFYVSPLMFVLSFAPVVRLFWTDLVRDRRRRQVERLCLLLCTILLQVGAVTWLWWGAPDV
ncbi:hypothetical protein [Yinghuangia sp. YIM S09857]|uniref:hypothetical protein n=1 Tax=Yinghuangia sp. YIM S09857 TaxID=3436929 RepID=UPI003F52B8B3